MSPIKTIVSSFVSYLIKKRLPRFLLSAVRASPIALNPIDLNFADPALAHEFYHGRFALSGRIVNSGAISPWLIEPPGREWEEALHDFSWLRHMSSAKTILAGAHARALVDEWVTLSDKIINDRAWAGHVTARRIISWLSHAEMLLSGSSPEFQRRFLKNLNLNIRYLRILRPLSKKTHTIEICSALCFAALALQWPHSRLRRAERQLEQALEQQILPDGGHVSRNPAALLPILADLIALCYSYQQSKNQIPVTFIARMEQIDGILRFFQHRDQTLAHFNGVGPLLPERLNSLLNIHGVATPPPTQVPYSGYQRLAYGATTVLVDTGCPPQEPQHHWSKTAHAGCLSFEMSSGTHCFIVNCGVDPYGGSTTSFFGRLTAAHSTATLNDTSSCQFRHPNQAHSLIEEGPDRVQIKHIEQPHCHGFVARHNGYGRRFNLLHQRSMALSKDGNLLQGADRFIKIKPDQSPIQSVATVRFHLHPDVEVSRLDDKSLRLEVMRADVWILTCHSEMSLEESIYFCGLQGPVKTRQIVFSFDPNTATEIYWAFARQTRQPTPPLATSSPLARS